MRPGARLLVAAAAVTALAGCGSPGGYGSSGSGSTGSTGSSSGMSADADAETIGTTSGSGGTYLTGDDGRAVYLFEADKSGTPTCSGACAQAWPPVLTDGAAKASGSAKATDLGTVKRSDGGTQVTYQGHPLYYYAEDMAAGDTHGQGSSAFGASWWLVTPDGSAMTSGAGTGSSTGSNSGSGSGSGSGYGNGGY